MNQFVGTVGNRLRDVRVTVQEIRQLPDPKQEFDPRYLVVMLTENNDIVLWFTATERCEEPGAVCYLSGTIKRQFVRKDARQTEVTRCFLATQPVVSVKAAKVGSADRIKALKLRWWKLGNKALRQLAGSPRQLATKQEQQDVEQQLARLGVTRSQIVAEAFE